MDDKKQSGVTPGEHGVEESTKGFPIVSKEDAENAAAFEMKKKNKDGSWETAIPVNVTGGDDAGADAAPAEDAPKAQEPDDKTMKINAVKIDDEAEQPQAAPRRATQEETQPFEPILETDGGSGNNRKPRKEKKSGGMGKRIAAVIAGVVVVAVVALSVYTYTYDKVFPGVKVADTYKLSGMTQDEAASYISGDVQKTVLAQSIELDGKDTVSGEDKTYEIKLSDVAEAVDAKASAQQAYQMGREGGYFQRVSTVLGCLFGGRDISLNATLKDGAVQEQVDKIAKDLAYEPVQPSWKVDKDKKELIVDTGKQGNEFDKSKVVSDISTQVENVDLNKYTIETQEKDQNKPDAAAIAKDVNTEAKNATVDKKDGKTIEEAVDGVKVEESAISSAIGDASQQTYTIPIELTKAQVTKADLEPLLFRDVLGSTTTYYNGGQAGRTTNVRLACSSINGTILNPGEEFSYNDIVGERTASRGYRSAIIFSNGSEVDGLGGGVCQVSSTVYMAVLRADLEVTERYNHQFQISYTPISQDAAVYWGSKDFKFVNNTPYPIKVVASSGGGSLTVQLYGTKTSDKTISFSSKSYTSGKYKYASLYKTVTENGKTTTTKVNSSAYLLNKK